MLMRHLFLVVFAASLFFGGRVALADCNQPPAPNVDWSRCQVNGRDLSSHDFTGSRIAEASFQRSSLDKANLTGVNAHRARFISSSLVGVIMDNGRFSEADMTRANLSGASMKNADLRRARFFGANLSNVDLTGAQIERADLTGANLSGARWTDGKLICAEGSIGQCN